MSSQTAVSSSNLGFFDNLSQFLKSPSLHFFQIHGVEILLVLVISVPLSAFFYLLLGRVRRQIVVDLGHHKWIVK